MNPLYTINDIAYIERNYRNRSNKELGIRLKRSAASVRKKRYKLGFNRTQLQLKRIFQRNSNLFKSDNIKHDTGSELMFGY